MVEANPIEENKEIVDTTSNPEQKSSDPKGTEVTGSFVSSPEQHLCIVGVDKHWIEKDLIKFLRKAFTSKPVVETSAAEGGSKEKDPLIEHDIPLKGVAKKRGKTFGFL